MDHQPSPRTVAAALGSLGVWTGQLSRSTAEESRRFVQGVEAAGLPTLWISEGGTSKEIFSHAGLLLAATDRLSIGTGIANIYARDPQAMMNGASTLGEAFPGRFVLGLGVSHAPRVEQRGHSYRPPLATMRDYLQAMRGAAYAGPEAQPAVPMVIGALGPRMTKLAAEMTQGVLPYFVPLEHVEEVRSQIGTDPVVAVELMVVADRDPARARTRARKHTAHYLELVNYRRNLQRLGYSDTDLHGGGSDRLIDALIAWGETAAIRARVDALLAAGADHVCLQILDESLPDALAVLEEVIAAPQASPLSTHRVPPAGTW